MVARQQDLKMKTYELPSTQGSMALLMSQSWCQPRGECAKTRSSNLIRKLYLNYHTSIYGDNVI